MTGIHRWSVDSPDKRGKYIHLMTPSWQLRNPDKYGLGEWSIANWKYKTVSMKIQICIHIKINIINFFNPVMTTLCYSTRSFDKIYDYTANLLYHVSSPKLYRTREAVGFYQWLSNLPRFSAIRMSKHLPNFQAIWTFYYPVSRVSRLYEFLW